MSQYAPKSFTIVPSPEYGWERWNVYANRGVTNQYDAAYGPKVTTLIKENIHSEAVGRLIESAMGMTFNFD